MEWYNAGGWLADHSAPAPFHGPAASTPQEPPDGPESIEDRDYDLYLDDWISRVTAGELDDGTGNMFPVIAQMETTEC